MKKTSIIAMLLAAVCATSCFVGGTFAKYTSSATATDSVQVAKWDVKFGGDSITTNNQAVTVDLFATINDTGNTDDEADVVDGKIAPGTAGSFTYNFKNDSEVTVNYTIEYTINAAGVPLEFKVGAGEWAATLDEVTGTMAIGAAATDVTVEWRWAYEQTDVAAGDAADTLLGVTPVEPSVTINATFTQAD